MSTAVPHYHGPSDISNDIHTSHRRTDGARRTCQAVYTISKDVCHSLMSLIGTVRWEGRFGASPTLPCQPVSLVLSRHGRTDVMAMKDALGGWSGGGPMHAQGSTVDTTPAHALGGRATVPADQRRQPAAAVISERR